MTKEIKIQISAWGIYAFFLGYFVLTYVTQNAWMVRYLELVVNLDLWLFTFIPALIMVVPIMLCRRNFADLQLRAAIQGSTPEQLETLSRTFSPKFTSQNAIALLSSAVLSTMVYVNGLPNQAVMMFMITFIAHALLVFVPLKKVDSRSPFI